MKVTYLGHSCLQIDSGGTRLVVDPGVFSDDLPDGADAVLLTHEHADHVDPEAVARLVSGGARLVGDAAALDVVRSSGALGGTGTAETAEPGGRWTFDGIEVQAVGGRHAVIHPDLPRATNVGFLVRADGTTLFHPGDTYEYIPEGVDVLAVPVTAPWASAADMVGFVRAVAPRQAVPIHDRILSEGGRGLYLGYLTKLGGADVHDISANGPLEA